jgi:hypothetical protein
LVERVAFVTVLRFDVFFEALAFLDFFGILSIPFSIGFQHQLFGVRWPGSALIRASQAFGWRAN